MQSGDDDSTNSMRSVIINTNYGFHYKLIGMKMTGTLECDAKITSENAPLRHPKAEIWRNSSQV